MAVSKLSQIAAAPNPPALSDKVVGVSGGSIDYQFSLSQLASTLGIIISTAAPSSPQAGQLWFNPTTQLMSVAEFPSYAWDPNRSFATVVLSGSNLTATRNDSTYTNIVTYTGAGAVSTNLLPAAQKYLFAITTSMDLAGNSGFGIGNDAQALGNAMFLGSTPPSPSPGIGYYVENLAYYFWVNNAGGYSGASPIGNGLHYVAIDPIAKKMWVKPIGAATWNPGGAGAGDPGLGTGGVPFTFDVATARIVAQFWVNGDVATIDATAAGVGIVTGFTPLSQIVLWVPLTYVNPTAINAGLVSIDAFGAIGDGVADDGSAFQAFTDAYQGLEVCLFLPSGKHYRSASNTLGLWLGIKKLTIIGYGATIDGMNSFGGVNDKYGLANSALVQSADVGTTQLTLISGGDASKFTNDDWIMIGALCIQGDGIPPNPYYMEYVQVTSVSGGVVFLDNALFNGPYLSTYPYYDSNSSGVNEGGPATIYNMTRMLPGWDADVYCFGVTFLNSAQMPVVRQLTYRDCSWPGLQSTNRPNPISSKDVIFDNCLLQGGGNIEIDKCMERMTFRNCQIGGYYNALLFQSSSVQQLIIDGCKIYDLSGTPRNTYITNSWIKNLTPGPRSNGPFESLFAENSFIGNLSFTGWGNSFGNANAITDFTFSNGTFSKANTGGTSCVTWAAPGAKCVFQGGDNFNRSPPYFTVLAVRSNTPGVAGTGNILIDTTLDSLPTWTQGTDPSAAFLPTIVCCHPYPRVTFRNCRGDRNVMNWQSNANPYRYEGSGFQYQQIILTGNVLATGNHNMHVEGYIQAININVLRAYTGANGTESLNWNNFNTYPAGTFAGAASPTLVVNVKTAGLRSWANGSWTGSAGGDTLPAITAGTWLYSYPEVFMNNDMSGDALSKMPIVLVEIIADVGNIKYPWIDYAGAFVRS